MKHHQQRLVMCFFIASRHLCKMLFSSVRDFGRFVVSFSSCKLYRHNINGCCLRYASQYAISKLKPPPKFERSKNVKTRAALIKTRNRARFIIWKKDGIKSFTLIFTILWPCLKLKSANRISDQTTRIVRICRKNCV